MEREFTIDDMPKEYIRDTSCEEMNIGGVKCREPIMGRMAEIGDASETYRRQHTLNTYDFYTHMKDTLSEFATDDCSDHCHVFHVSSSKIPIIHELIAEQHFLHHGVSELNMKMIQLNINTFLIIGKRGIDKPFVRNGNKWDLIQPEAVAMIIVDKE